MLNNKSTHFERLCFSSLSQNLLIARGRYEPLWENLVFANFDEEGKKGSYFS